MARRSSPCAPDSWRPGRGHHRRGHGGRSGGRPLPGAAVELSTAGRLLGTSVTGADGRFTFENVAAGPHEIRVKLAGFRQLLANLAVGNTAPPPIRLTLQIGSVSETVIVSAASPIASQAAPRDVAAKAPGAAPERQAAITGARGNVQGFIAGGAGAPPMYGVPDTETVRRHRREHVPHVSGASPVDLLDRRRHRVLRQRAPVPQRGPAAAGRRRAHRGADQLLPVTTTPTPTRARRSAITTEVAPCPWDARHRLVLIGLQARAYRGRTDAAPQPRVPARRLGLDASSRQAAARQERDAAARRHAAASRTGSRSSSTRGPAAWPCPPRAAIACRRSGARSTRLQRRRLDQRRRGHPSSPTRSRPRTSSRAASTA